MLGPECPHSFGYTMLFSATTLRTDFAGAMSNAITDLIKILPTTNWF